MAKYRRLEEEDNGLSYAEEFEAQNPAKEAEVVEGADTTYKKRYGDCLLYTSPSPRD